MLRTTIFITLMLGLCLAAFAVPNLNVETGGVQLPDASVAPQGAIQVAAAYVRSEGTNELVPLPFMVCHGDGYNVRVLGGIAKRLELGAGYLGIDKAAGTANAWTVAAKWKIIDRPCDGLGLALGAAYRGWNSDLKPFLPIIDKLDLPNVFSAYLALDKTWPTCDTDQWQTTTTLGLMYDRYSETKLPGPRVILPGPKGITQLPFVFGGDVPAENFINPFFGVKISKGGWSFIGEFKPKLRKDHFFYQKDVWTAAVRKQCCNDLTITTGVTNFNIPYTNSDPGFFFDLCYRFGK
jgi:hypothetical protein